MEQPPRSATPVSGFPLRPPTRASPHRVHEEPKSPLSGNGECSGGRPGLSTRTPPTRAAPKLQAAQIPLILRRATCCRSTLPPPDLALPCIRHFLNVCSNALSQSVQRFGRSHVASHKVWSNVLAPPPLDSCFRRNDGKLPPSAIPAEAGIQSSVPELSEKLPCEGQTHLMNQGSGARFIPWTARPALGGSGTEDGPHKAKRFMRARPPGTAGG
jgi:hypothetical protein